MKTLLLAFLLASCSTKPIIPTDTEQQKECAQMYAKGRITWAQYKDCVKSGRSTVEDGP